SALRKASERSPSEKFRDFIDNLISVINSGGDVTAYFKIKYDHYYSIAEQEQKMFLEFLGLLAETYITAFVAGPLFLITIIVVLSLINQGSTMILYLTIYVIIPLSTVAFIVLLDVLSGVREDTPVIYTTTKELKVFKEVSLLDTEESQSELYKALKRYEKFREIKNFLRNPFKTFYETPKKVLFISAPISLLYLSINMILHYDSITSFKDAINLIDDYIVFSTLIILIPYAIFYELRTHKIRKLESKIPDFLKQLASINEAGLSLKDAIGIIMKSNIGVLSTYVKRIWKDIEWGSPATEALIKFEKRVRTSTISRTITLIVKASEITSDITTVLNIAANDADTAQKLKQDRFSNMFIYIIVVYISFFVFLAIVYILSAVFLSMISSSQVSASGIATSELISTVNLESYNRLFFHAAIIQGFCSGLIAGQMGEGNLHYGFKHSIIMVVIAYIVFTLFI
ncbi:MAG: type II secretion system F family protein, partial [Methanosarcinales archaeon]